MSVRSPFRSSMLGLVCVASFAQAFDVASVKLAEPIQGIGLRAISMNGGPGTADPTHLIYRHTALRVIARVACGVSDDQIIAPDWMSDSQKYGYDLIATMPPGTTPEQFRAMLQNLLAERFHLKVNHKTKQFPGYELLVATGGPSIKAGAADEESGDPPKVLNLNNPPVDADGFPRRDPGRSLALKTPPIGEWGEIRASVHMSMDEFAAWLGGELIAANGLDLTAPIPRVVNRTSLSGKYDFRLRFAGGTFFGAARGPFIDAIRARQGDAAAPGTQASEPEGRRGPGISIFDALKQQAGLELKKTKDVDLDIIEIVSAEKTPTPN